MNFYLTDESRKLLFVGTEEECLAEMTRLRSEGSTYRGLPLYVYDEDNYKSIWKPPQPTTTPRHFITIVGTDIVEREVASYTFNNTAEGAFTTVTLVDT